MREKNKQKGGCAMGKFNNNPINHISIGQLEREYSPINCQNSLYDVSTFKIALDKNIPSLAKLVTLHGKERIIGYIEKWIYDLIRWFGFKNNPNTDQVYQIAGYVIQDFGDLNLAEVYLFFTKVKKGELVTFYGKIDGYSILSALRNYYKMRSGILHKYNESVNIPEPMHVKAKLVLKQLLIKNGAIT